MKIMLINPPGENEITGSLPSFVTGERGYSPPLGLLYIAGYLQKHSNHEVCIIDSQVEQLDYKDIGVRVRDFNPDIVGITTLTMALVDVQLTIKTVKEISRDIVVVLGGPHVHLYPNETINLEGVDYVVQGEGEEVFSGLVDNINNKEVLSKTPGLLFKDGDIIVNTGLCPPIEKLDRLPFPARNLVPYKKYTSLLAQQAIVTTIFTSRGCPYKCTFCDRHHLGKNFRSRSAENVIDELQECVNMGIRAFLIYDDTFTINRQRVIDICKGIVARGLDISWNIRSRVDTIDDEMLSYLKKAGCHGINYGVESGSNRILKRLSKGITIEKVFETFKLTRKNGIDALAYFMIGNPGETIEDIETTFAVMRKLKPDYVHITVLTPFPGTKIYDEALEKGIIPTDCWREFSQHPTVDFSMPHWSEYFSMAELSELLVKGYKSFYCRTGFIVHSMFKIRSMSELRKKVTAGLRLIFSRS